MKKRKLDRVCNIATKSIHSHSNTPNPNWEKAITSHKYVGAHVSAAGSLSHAFTNNDYIGGTCFALFLSNQRQWKSKPLTLDQIQEFKAAQEKSQIKWILPHGSYLVNMGNPNKEMRIKSYESFLQDLKKCESLGISMYNFQYLLLAILYIHII